MSVISSRLTALALALPLCFGAGSLAAHEYTHGDLKIDHPWTRATPTGATVAGGFMTIANQGQQADRLVSATSSVAGHMEIHEMRMDGEIMRMRELPNGLTIEGGKTATLAPGGYHIMFMELKQSLQQDSKIPVTLTFEKAGAVTVDLVVKAMGTRESGHHQPEHQDASKKQ